MLGRYRHERAKTDELMGTAPIDQLKSQDTAVPFKRASRHWSKIWPVNHCDPGAAHESYWPGAGEGPMIKSELVERLAERHGLPNKRTAETAVNAVLNRISEALARDRRVELRGFGAFSIKIRPPRLGRNPRSGKAVQLGERRFAFFRSGKEMRARLNQEETTVATTAKAGTAE
jgi:integration host factor subunit beta